LHAHLSRGLRAIRRRSSGAVAGGGRSGIQLVGALIIGRLSDRYGLAFTVFQIVLSLFAQKRLALDARATSCVFSYVGLRIVAIQGDGTGLLEKIY
jgi:MFS family permease